jgi:hypothetical protein
MVEARRTPRTRLSPGIPDTRRARCVAARDDRHRRRPDLGTNLATVHRFLVTLGPRRGGRGPEGRFLGLTLASLGGRVESHKLLVAPSGTTSTRSRPSS